MDDEGRVEYIRHKLLDTAEIARLRAENKRLREKLEARIQWVHDLQSGMWINCVYCGHRYGPNDEIPTTMADALKEHIEQCPKHPMSALKAQAAQLRDEAKQLRDDLSTAKNVGIAAKELAKTMKELAESAYRVGERHTADAAALREALVLFIQKDSRDDPCWCGACDEPHSLRCEAARAAIGRETDRQEGDRDVCEDRSLRERNRGAT